MNATFKHREAGLDQFDVSLSFPLKKHDFEKTREEINAEQKEKDKLCMLKIKRAMQFGIITPDAAAYLEQYYADGMNVYAQMFRTLDKTFGEEESITIVDPITHEVLLENAKLRHVTPNTCAIFKYSGKHKNPIYLTLPGMKNIDRALEKVRIGGKYTNHEQLRDILRFSISGKRYGDIADIDEKFFNLPNIHIDPKKTKDKFCNNDVSRYPDYNEKNFRNKVVILELSNGIQIEGQEKIISLDNVDMMTHKIYEQLRVLKEDNDISAEEKKLQITSLEWSISELYRWGIEKHNQNEVLEKVFRMEERFNFIGKSKNKDGLYDDCIEFINRNFLARPKQALVENNLTPDMSVETKERLRFDTLSPEIKELFKNATDDIKNIFTRYRVYIEPKYRCSITGNENRFNKGR